MGGARIAEPRPGLGPYGAWGLSLSPLGRPRVATAATGAQAGRPFTGLLLVPHKCQRIDLPAVPNHLEVNVGSRGPARRAHQSDRIAALHRLSH
jgi:hypothetical protein